MHLPYSPNPMTPPSIRWVNQYHYMMMIKRSCRMIEKSIAWNLKRRAARRQHLKLTLWRLKDSEELFFDNSITQAEDERTTMAKNDNKNARRIAIDAAHAKQDKPQIGMVQQGRNTAYTFGSALKRQFKSITKSKHVCFAKQHTVRQIDENITCVMVDYDSGADGNYISEEDRRKAGLPILEHRRRK